MSEGIFFHSAIPNITLYVHGYVIKFKDGRYPPHRKAFCTDEGEIAAIKNHDSYGKTIESNVDREERLTPDPKVVEDLQAKALERLKDIPGVVPSELMESSPHEDPPPKSQKQESEPQQQAPSLTEVSRMNKSSLTGLADSMGIEVTSSDTVVILRRKVRSWIKQNT
jgi:hypothetical protein